ncbi:MAG TPA: hypothetical protein VHS06_09065 [Chloroflexota bacterium]|nr:hypothetical protein [Chloroflexota bacterium]
MTGPMLKRLIRVSIVAAIATTMLGFTVGIAAADPGDHGRGHGNHNAHGQVEKQSHNSGHGWNRDNDYSLRDDEDSNDDSQDDQGDRDENSRPGWGWGDRNHEHFGPPGQGCDVEDECEEGRGAPSDVSTLAATHFAVSAPSSASTGTAFNFTVRALDQNNDRTDNYDGTVHFTTSDGSASLPADAKLSNGVGTFSAMLRTTGNQTITAADTGNSSIAGTSGTIVVSSGATTHFVVTAPSSATSGSAFSFTVRALDANNRRVFNYSGTVHFTSSDGSASLPSDATLSNGRGSFTATLRTTGNQNITATDTSNSSIAGTSGNIAVSSTTSTHLALSSVPSTATAGSAFTVTVTAQDQNDNTVTGFGDTIHFTSSDGSAVLPNDATLSNGTATFSVTLKTAGSQTISVSDTSNSAVAGASASVTVSPAGATHLAVLAPNSATSGTAFNFTVTALDQFNNTATGYTGTVHFTSNDSAAVLPADSTLTNGTKAFSATLKTAGSRAITTTDKDNASITGTSATIAVS